MVVIIACLVPDDMCSTLTVPTCSMSKNTCTIPSTVPKNPSMGAALAMVAKELRFFSKL